MSPETFAQRPRRRITLWVLRLGIGGFFVAASAVALVSFSLFGCPCLPPLRVPEGPAAPWKPPKEMPGPSEPLEPPKFGTPK